MISYILISLGFIGLIFFYLLFSLYTIRNCEGHNKLFKLNTSNTHTPVLFGRGKIKSVIQQLRPFA
jgi:hypothetical protein